VWLLTVGMVGVGIAAWAGVLDHFARAVDRQPLLGPFIAAGLVAVSLLTVTFSFRDDTATVGLTDIPIVVGIVFLRPSWLLVAIVIAQPIVGVLKRRAPSKVLFNTVSYAIAGAAAVGAYHVALGGESPVALRGWGAAAAAVVVVNLVTAVAVALAVAVNAGRFPGADMVGSLRAAAVGVPLSVVLALIAITLVWTSRLAGLLFVCLGALAAVAHRSSTEMRSRYANLERLYRFTEQTEGISELAEVVPVVLRRGREVMGAEEIELTVAQGATSVRYSLDGDDQLVRSSAGGVGGFERLVAEAGKGILAPRGHGRPPVMAALAERGLRDAIAVPIATGDGVPGTLIVGNRRGPVSFTGEDLRLFETLSAHGGVAIRGGRLLDQLRGEVSAREHDATHDGLTGLANRALFTQAVRDALERRPVGGLVAVMLMDLDGFKEVNDTLGHHTGDAILEEVAARLTGAMAGHGLVARLGGDEFAFVLPKPSDVEEVAAVARGALHALALPLAVDDLVLGLRASLGVSIGPEHGEATSILLQRADVAMYAAKATGTGMEVYDPSTDHHSTRRLLLATELRRALDTDAIELWYQAQADLKTGEVVGCEALLRWTHPLHGEITPDEFIPAAEQSGTIGPLTWWVLDVAIAQARAWLDRGIGLGIAVNVSARSLLDHDMVGRLERMLAVAGLEARWLTLELTESSIMADPVRSGRVLAALAAIGVQLAIDDFGTGYSSLSRLKRLPIQAVKIDKSFVIQMGSDDSDAAIVRSTIDLARNLGHTVVAEGVEDQVTWDRLAALGCDVAQGFHLARAMPAPAFEAWFQQRRMGKLTLWKPPAEAPGA
jgi:diguanylate cyclase (GGDEF)-like protein